MIKFKTFHNYIKIKNYIECEEFRINKLEEHINELKDKLDIQESDLYLIRGHIKLLKKNYKEVKDNDDKFWPVVKGLYWGELNRE